MGRKSNHLVERVYAHLSKNGCQKSGFLADPDLTGTVLTDDGLQSQPDLDMRLTVDATGRQGCLLLLGTLSHIWYIQGSVFVKVIILCSIFVIKVMRLITALTPCTALTTWESDDPCVRGSGESHSWTWVLVFRIKPFRPRPRVAVGVTR
jgi:hypothetical protein